AVRAARGLGADRGGDGDVELVAEPELPLVVGAPRPRGALRVERDGVVPAGEDPSHCARRPDRGAARALAALALTARRRAGARSIEAATIAASVASLASVDPGVASVVAR